MLDFDANYAALLRRDPALDGVVFVAVKTTGIYCRPVCPARTPFARNVVLYPSAAAAERAGYRPCLRCRPETAPFCLPGTVRRQPLRERWRSLRRERLTGMTLRPWPKSSG